MTDPHSQGTGWSNEDYDAPTRISEASPAPTSESGASRLPLPHGESQWSSQQGPTENGQAGPPSSMGARYGNPQYGSAGQYGSPGYAPPQYNAGGHGAPQVQFGGVPNGMAPHGAYPPSPAIPGVTVDPLTGEPLSDKSKVAAGFLQFFLGGFGAGRFYIGDTTLGAIQLGLFIFGWITALFFIGFFILLGLGFWVFIDAILMWTGSVRDGQGRKLR